MSSVANALRQRDLELYVITKTHGYKQGRRRETLDTTTHRLKREKDVTNVTVPNNE